MNHIASTSFSGEDFRSLLRNGPPRRSVEAERLHRKQRLAATFRLFSRLGFDQGLAGHVTARDPERTDHFWVNPLGRHFGQIRVSDPILVNHEGDVVEGDWPVNRAAFAIHSAIHTARPDVVAAAHTHSGAGKAFAALGRTLDPLTQDSCAFYEDHALFDDFSGVVLEASEGRRIADALGNHKAVILKNHGLLTVADSVEAAAWWFIAFNDAAQAQLSAQAAGPTHSIPHDVAKLTASQVGTARGGLLNFYPLWESVLAEAPDFLQ